VEAEVSDHDYIRICTENRKSEHTDVSSLPSLPNFRRVFNDIVGVGLGSSPSSWSWFMTALVFTTGAVTVLENPGNKNGKYDCSYVTCVRTWLILSHEKMGLM